jgi:diguanylate cyclase (GGDEF)-like protein/PAS domain S-box-containing protein
LTSGFGANECEARLAPRPTPSQEGGDHRRWSFVKRRVDPTISVVLVFTVAVAVPRAFVTRGLVGEAIFLIAPMLPLAALTVAAHRRDERDPTAWSILAAGMAFLFASELVGSWLELTDPDRFPSPGDYLNAIGIALIVFGLWRTAARLSPVGDRTGFVDATVLALGVGTLGWLFLVEPSAGKADLGGSVELWTVLPLALDIAMLAMASRLAFALRVRPRAYVFIYLAVAGAMIVDVIDSILELGLRTEIGRFEDPIFIVSFGCWAAAALAAGPVARAQVSAMRYLSGRRATLLVGCLSVPLLALIVQELRGERPGSATLLVVALVELTIGGLVVLRIAGLIAAVRDLATAEGVERFAALVENASDVIVTVDPDLVITYASPSTATAWGLDPVALIGRRFTDVVAPEEAAIVASQLERAAALPAGSRLTLETRVRRRGGGHRICEAVMAGLTDHEGVRGISVTLRDVTDQRALENELRTRAFNDELTGLANRALFMNRVEHGLSPRAERSDRIAILYLDLDDFKQVNDGLGHAAGDELLAAVGQRLKECVRPGDTVARLGGDEFAVLLEHGDGPVEAVSVAARIQEVLALPLPAGELHLGVRASIGIAVAQFGSTSHDLLRNAGIAMYEAKSSGGTRYTVFDPSMRAAAANRISLRSDLEKAIGLDQLHVVYQPIFDLKTRRVSGAEALLRWEHPIKGSISPVEFIPIAEQSGSITEIGEWVLERACLKAAGWARRGHRLSVSVNVSAVQLQDPIFSERVREVLELSRLSPQSLIVEITETAMMNDPEATAGILAALRSIGIRVAVDDFGTGYCSLAYLKRFAVDSLKIDRAFVSEIGPKSKNLLAHSILRLADSLGVPSVAEGIEHQAQLENLALNGCAFGQGFLLARPMKEDDFDTFLALPDPSHRPKEVDA